MDKPRPYVTAALFCEKVLQEKDEVISVMRIVDHLQYSFEGYNVPATVKPAINVQALVSVKAGPALGEHLITLELEKPDGVRKEVFAAPVSLTSPDQGQNVIAGITIGADVDGLYWMNVMWDGEILTRVPLKITRQEKPAPSATKS